MLHASAAGRATTRRRPAAQRAPRHAGSGGTLAGLLLGALLAASLNAAEPAASAQAAEHSESATAASGSQGETPLHWAAYGGDEAQVRQLLAAGTDVDVRLAKGSTPLHLAAYRGHSGVVRLLLAHGAAVNARTRDGVTPLDWAQHNGHTETVALLKAQGATHGQMAARPAPAQTATADAMSQPPAPRQQAGEHRQSAPAAVPSDYWVQLGAFSSAQRANAAQALLRERHPETLAGQTLVVEQARVRGRDYYRVQLPQPDRDSATALCARLEQSGQACRVFAR
jgi:ankyrin repeat protein